MKIAIISDTHDNVPNLEKALLWMKENKIKKIIHCGDLCAPSILSNVLVPGFAGDIHMVFGNVEDRDILPQIAKDFKNVKHYGDLGEIELDNKKIAFLHFPDKAKVLAKSGKYDYVFYGHTHKPWLETIGHCQLLNPGTLAGLFYKATFAVWDTESGKLELKLLETLKSTNDMQIYK
ncbi:MAG: YfcE family phosphodiesterase [Patescibacteria group bacterium]|nr:YfcE family phosphodiesterase [Patescibacteria group bacterium]MDD4610924.1 YfcE family phosphodiesterase [Patescibacteria group bacterium]